jgi:Flp pilus assembly protein TadB
MNQRDLRRHRRCRAIPVAVVLGILLPVFQPSSVTIGAAVAGIAILVVLYWRECRHRTGTKSPQEGTHTRAFDR